MNHLGCLTDTMHHGNPGGGGGGGVPSTGMGSGSLNSSVESVGAEDSPPPALSARQDPPGQEHPAAEPFPCHNKMQWEGVCHHGDCHLGDRLQLMSLDRCRTMTTPTKSLGQDHEPFPSTPLVFHAHQHVPTFHQYNNRYDPPFLPTKPHILPSMPPAMRPMVPQSLAMSGPAVGCDPAMPRHVQMEALLWENERLKKELDAQQDISTRIQRLEQELRRVSDAYSELIQACADREAEEDQQREHLLQDIRRLQQLNNNLRDTLEETSRQAAEEVELADRHHHQMIALITQNEVQQQECVCLQRQLRQVRVRWHELRVHAAALERALCASERRSRQLETELQTQQACADTAQQLQGALSRLQDTCARREELEKELRVQLKQQLRRASDSSSPDDQPDTALESRLAVMTALVHQKDEVIRHLQQRLRETQNQNSASNSNKSQSKTNAESTHPDSPPAETEEPLPKSPPDVSPQSMTAVSSGSLPHSQQASDSENTSSCHLSGVPIAPSPVPGAGPDQAIVDFVQEVPRRPPNRLEGLDVMQVEAVEVFI